MKSFSLAAMSFFLVGWVSCPPVFAEKKIDYQKCESMERARDRAVENPLLVMSRENALARARIKALNQGRPDLTSVERIDVMVEWSSQLAKGEGDPLLIEAWNKVGRIRRDIKEAGSP